MRQVHAESHGIYGSQKIARVLAERDDLETACRNTVALAMQEMGLKSRVSRGFTPTTTQADPSKQPAPNTLERDFAAAGPNRKWTSDITYLPTAAGWVYLAVVMDLFSRRVLGWSIAAHMTELLVLDALQRAIRARQPPPGLIHHSDRGGQYAGHDYRAVLRRATMRQSMSRAANCYDNAFMESCFGTI